VKIIDDLAQGVIWGFLIFACLYIGWLYLSQLHFHVLP
jgi:hypothetical protein